MLDSITKRRNQTYDEDEEEDAVLDEDLEVVVAEDPDAVEEEESAVAEVLPERHDVDEEDEIVNWPVIPVLPVYC